MNSRRHIEELLKNYSDIIASVEELHITERPHLTVIRAKIILINSSVLYVREIWRNEEKVAFSYFWFSPDGRLIEGWDNAPHHPEIETFPDHAHTREGIRPLRTSNLTAFLEKIRRSLLPP
ncbi:hypothetical protein DRO33_00855 [Candidatus Bathyarchaeota archaeon]|nr:MAG: hypothetical protein DRO33_00855 [Candidatus Bathyarchaeota archaeon]